MTPAKAIAAALTAHGITTQGNQAELLGVSQQLWSLWVRGDKRMREDSIGKALNAAEDAGYSIELKWDSKGVTS